jgi:transcriptional regulator of acetoin/glycerol metabolism
MMLYSWPANVRDLERLLLGLDPERGILHEAVARALGPLSLSTAQAITPERIEETLKACGWNQSEAARQLGMTRGALLRRLAKSKRE